MIDYSMRRTWGPTPKFNRVMNYKRPEGQKQIIVAGPCSVENTSQIYRLADFAASMGATHLRGGVFRAGTYPGENFGWVHIDLIRAFHEAARANGLKNIIEILDYSPESLEKVLPYADCVQVGARSMQNYTLLKKLAKTTKQIFLKRHPGTTLDEWLGSAEHLLAGSALDLVLIERGSVSHVNHCRWDLSISMIPAVKSICDIPIIVDASHGTGRRDLVEPMTLAGIAAGADGMLVEIHEDPNNSLSDPDQAVTPHTFERIVKKSNAIKGALNALS